MCTENNNKKRSILETIKWISVIVFVTMSIVGNYLYRDYNAFIRGMVILVVISVVIYIISTTKVGKVISIFRDESRAELRKIIWPTYQEGLNTTLIVIGVTMVMSLLLWGLDTMLVYAISFSLRL